MRSRGIWGAAMMILRVCRQCSQLEGGLELVQAVMVASMGVLGVVRKPKKIKMMRGTHRQSAQGRESKRGVDV